MPLHLNNTISGTVSKFLDMDGNMIASGWTVELMKPEALLNGTDTFTGCDDRRRSVGRQLLRGSRRRPRSRRGRSAARARFGCGHVRCSLHQRSRCRRVWGERRRVTGSADPL